LSKEERRYLAGLPEEIVEGEVLYTHISPRPSRQKILDATEAWNVFDEFPFRLVFIGHLHMTVIFGERCDGGAMASMHPYRFNRPFDLDPSDRYIICPGAIGYPRDGVELLRYGIFDDRAQTVEVRALKGPVIDLGLGQLFE
jgi:diadenosine tetraphosphatase ApaH/serine/threonine PP2A family protein phosphatase